MKPSDYWRLHTELTIVQATYLVLDIDPHLDSQFQEYPAGFLVLEEALARALKSSALAGRIKERTERKGSWLDETEQHIPIPETVDLSRSVVDVASLKQWLADNHVHSDFFQTKVTSPLAFLDAQGDRRAPKLIAAVAAWHALEDPDLRRNKSVKQAVIDWLLPRAGELGLLKKDGKPNMNGIEEIAKVVNWEPDGGAPVTGGAG